MGRKENKVFQLTLPGPFKKVVSRNGEGEEASKERRGREKKPLSLEELRRVRLIVREDKRFDR
jgi:hypothetical protein